MNGTQIRGLALIAALTLATLMMSAKCKKDEPAANGAQEQSVKIRLAIQPGNIHVLAQELGYFKEAGLDVEISTFSYGPPIIEALTSGSVDFGLLGDLPVFSGVANGVDIRIPAIASSSSLSYGMLVRSDAGINAFADLKGKKVAVPFGSNVQPLLYLYLEKAGLKDTDLEIINLSATDSVGAITGGRIDAAVIWDPYLTLGAAQSEGKVKLLSTAEGYKVFVNPLIARGTFVDNYPEQTAAFLSALNKALVWIRENEEDAMKLLSEISEVPLDIIRINLPKADIRPNLTKERIDALIASADEAYRYGLLPDKIDVASHITTAFLEKAGIQ
jgi:aliphatic sulfonates family ABC transporter substrate-binding protein